MGSADSRGTHADGAQPVQGEMPLDIGVERFAADDSGEDDLAAVQR
jgi:hypothetical protein